jgi:type I restriction enzyme, S subunit
MRVTSIGDVHSGYLYAFLSSSLGQAQIRRSTYGSVVPMLHSTHLSEVLIPIPNDGGNEIGQLVEQGFGNRETAQNIESEAIELLMAAVRDGYQATKSN